MGIASADLRDHHDVIVIGAGQAGLATGYHLAQRGLDFIILDAAEHVGDSWRMRWDSLRLFTPARYDSLPGLSFPGPPWSYPSKDDVADYLVSYATRFALPVHTGSKVETVTRRGGNGAAFVVSANGRQIEADNVVVAGGAWHEPLVPGFAGELDPSILQLHSSEYRRPSQLREGPVLVVGAANSGAEIALDVAREHPTTLVGRDTGQIPLDGALAARITTPLIWFAANHLITVGNPIGRKARDHERFHGEPVERARPKRLRAAGVDRRFVRAVGARNGLPLLDNDAVIDTNNVIWATGFRRDFSWIDLPIFDEHGWPNEDHGIVSRMPGLYFVGLPFQRAMASALVGGVGRDAAAIVDHLAARAEAVQVHVFRDVRNVADVRRA